MLSNQDTPANPAGHYRLSRAAANDPFYCAAVGAAKTRAYRAAVTAGLSPTEREDLYQALLLDIYERTSKNWFLLSLSTLTRWKSSRLIGRFMATFPPSRLPTMRMEGTLIQITLRSCSPTGTATMICFRTRAPSTTCSLRWPT